MQQVRPFAINGVDGFVHGQRLRHRIGRMNVDNCQGGSVLINGTVNHQFAGSQHDIAVIFVQAGFDQIALDEVGKH